MKKTHFFQTKIMLNHILVIFLTHVYVNEDLVVLVKKKP